MADHHHHCSDEGHDGHDHDHDTPGELGAQDNLYAHIDLPNVVALNADGDGHSVIKPWDQRSSEDVALESDADDQMILRVPFTGSVKLRALLLKTGPGGQTPQTVSLFSNEESLDFSDVEARKPTQAFDVAVGREVGEYAVMRAKFANATSVTLYFPKSQGADTVKVYYVGFLGQFSERKGLPVGIVYEASPNLADHLKIQGTVGSLSGPQI